MRLGHVDRTIGVSFIPGGQGAQEEGKVSLSTHVPLEAQTVGPWHS